MSGSNGSAARVLEAFKRRGQRVTLRSVTILTPADLLAEGETPPVLTTENLRNPPQIASPTIQVASTGATTGTINGDLAQGVLLPGDKFRAVGQTAWLTVAEHTLLGAAASNPMSLTWAGGTLNFAPGTWAAGLPTGSAVAIEFQWLNDISWWARVESFPLQLVDGVNILSGDLRVSMPAYGLRVTPKPGDQLLLAAPVVDAEIKSVSPVYMAGGGVSHYSILAR